MKNRVPLINQIANEFVPQLSHDKFDALSDLTNITGEVIIRTFFGEDLKNATMNGKPI